MDFIDSSKKTTLDIKVLVSIVLLKFLWVINLSDKSIWEFDLVI